MIGLSLNIVNLPLNDVSNIFNALTSSYRSRVLSDGGTVEALSCVNAITNTFN
tara:strand:- start:447 stop:605 length:159 start_codon:yes stop_codon:yes gene_type:complete